MTGTYISVLATYNAVCTRRTIFLLSRAPAVVKDRFAFFWIIWTWGPPLSHTTLTPEHYTLNHHAQTHGRPSLVVRRNVLTAGSAYVFRLSAIETASQNTGEPYMCFVECSFMNAPTARRACWLLHANAEPDIPNHSGLYGITRQTR